MPSNIHQPLCADLDYQTRPSLTLQKTERRSIADVISMHEFLTNEILNCELGIQVTSSRPSLTFLEGETGSDLIYSLHSAVLGVHIYKYGQDFACIIGSGF